MRKALLIFLTSFLIKGIQAQKTVEIKGLDENTKLFKKEIVTKLVPDMEIFIENPEYEKHIEETKYYGSVVLQLTEMIEKLVNIYENKIIKKEKKKVLNEAYDLVQKLKKRIGSNFKNVKFIKGYLGYEYDYIDLKFRAKSEEDYYTQKLNYNLERSESKKENLRKNLSKEEIDIIPKIETNIETLLPLKDFNQIKGDYFFAGYIFIVKEHDFLNKLYEGQVNRSEQMGFYDLYNDYNLKNNFKVAWYKSSEGKGIDFYNLYGELSESNTIDKEYSSILNEGAKQLNAKLEITKLNPYLILNDGSKIEVTNGVFKYLKNKDYDFIEKNKQIINNAKKLLKKADPFLKQMYQSIIATKNFTMTSTMKTLFVNNTNKVKMIDTDIRNLYGNDEDNLYDFTQLFDNKINEDFIYFNKILNTSKQILGL